MINIKIVLLRKESITPVRQTEGAAGMDLHACIDEPLELMPGKRAVIPVGIALEVPRGFEAQIRARSGLAMRHGIGLANGVGTIDSDYRGEIKVVLINQGDEPFVVRSGMRVAQMVIARYEIPEWNIVTELSETERSDNNFGSTGLGGMVG
jgi:dUTP pyrophosphatase